MPTKLSRMDTLHTFVDMAAWLIQLVSTKDMDRVSTVLILTSVTLTLVASVLLAVPLVLA